MHAKQIDKLLQGEFYHRAVGRCGAGQLHWVMQLQAIARLRLAIDGLNLSMAAHFVAFATSSGEGAFGFATFPTMRFLYLLEINFISCACEQIAGWNVTC